MALALLDNLTADMASLKHYTQALRNENIEMKQSIADLSTNRFELTREIKFLKEIVSQLISQQNVINNSLTNLNKDTKSLKNNGAQTKSKLDIIQVRLKNISQNQSQSQKIAASRQGCSTEPDEKKDPLDFPVNSNATDKITNKTTKDRLERMRKDLQDVFNKKREEKIETVRPEIMDDWPSHSDLNISHSEDNRTQSTVTMNPTGDHSFNTGINQAQPCSLMEQVEMLNLPHMPKDPYMFGSIMLETSPNGAANFKKDSMLDKRSLANSEVLGHKMNISPVANMGSALNGTGINLASSIYLDPGNKGSAHFTGLSTRERIEVSPHNFVEDKKLGAVKGLAESQYSSHSLKPAEQHLSSMLSTTGGISQSTVFGSETSTYYPTSQVKHEENYGQKYDIYSHSNSYRSQGSSKDILGYRYSDPGPSQPGGLDHKTKKELYLQAENMLVNVLDRLEEPYKTTTTTHHGHSNSYNVSSDVYRYNSHRNPLEYSSQGHGNVMRPAIQEYETNANDVSTTLSNSGTSSRGTKKLKLFRKGIKNKDEFDSPKDSNLLHPNYGNPR